MFFSKISLPNNLQTLKKLDSFRHRTEYYYHQLLWKLFSEKNSSKKRDFLYRFEMVNRLPFFYTVSTVEPKDNQDILTIISKKYCPQIKINQVLTFQLRTNPRQCRYINIAGEMQKKHVDIIQNSWHLHRERIEKNEVSKDDLMQIAGEKWLSNKSVHHGFRLEKVLAEKFEKVSFNKKDRRISFSTLDFKGRLTVTDPELFLTALYTGIGSAKGFGCGLLMVKP